MSNKLLDEERYQKIKKKITGLALIILIIGLLLGGSLIATGIINQIKVDKSYSKEAIAELREKLDIEKINLENKKSELENKREVLLSAEKQKLEDKKSQLKSKGVKYDAFAKYDDGEKYDLYIITKTLDPSFDYCHIDEYKNNSITNSYCLIKNHQDDTSKKLSDIEVVLNSSCSFNKNASYDNYCNLKQELDKKTNMPNSKSFESSKFIPFYMIGGFIIISTLMISAAIYSRAKAREILAFQAQQVMPVASEGLENIAPSIGKAGASIAKEMGPVYGEMAKEITKGIREGLKSEEKK